MHHQFMLSWSTWNHSDLVALPRNGRYNGDGSFWFGLFLFCWSGRRGLHFRCRNPSRVSCIFWWIVLSGRGSKNFWNFRSFLDWVSEPTYRSARVQQYYAWCISWLGSYIDSSGFARCRNFWVHFLCFLRSFRLGKVRRDWMFNSDCNFLSQNHFQQVSRSPPTHSTDIIALTARKRPLSGTTYYGELAILYQWTTASLMPMIRLPLGSVIDSTSCQGIVEAEGCDWLGNHFRWTNQVRCLADL